MVSDNEGGPHINRERAIFSQENVRSPSHKKPEAAYAGDAFLGKAPVSIEVRDSADEDDNQLFYWE